MILGCGSPRVLQHTHKTYDTRKGYGGLDIKERRLAGPTTYHIDVTAEHLEDYIVQAAQYWNDMLGAEILVYGGVVDVPRGTGIADSIEDDISVVYAEDRWTEDMKKQDFVIGTTLWFEGQSEENKNIIMNPDIILNTQTYTFIDALEEECWEAEEACKNEKDPKNKRIPADALMVLIHEFGHMVGLGHNSAPLGFGVMSKALSIECGFAMRQALSTTEESLLEKYKEMAP